MVAKVVVVVGATFVVVEVGGVAVVVVVVGASVSVVVVSVVAAVGAAVTTSFAVATTVGGVKVSDVTDEGVTVVMVTVVSWRRSSFTVWELLRVDVTVEAFSDLSGEVMLSRGEETETELVTLSVRGASVSGRLVKEDRGAVGRSGFLGNSPRASSKTREHKEGDHAF